MVKILKSCFPSCPEPKAHKWNELKASLRFPWWRREAHRDGCESGSAVLPCQGSSACRERRTWSPKAAGLPWGPCSQESRRYTARCDQTATGREWQSYWAGSDMEQLAGTSEHRTPSLAITSSPVPCMISRGMAKILLYIRTDLRPLLIFTRRTRKLVPPRSRARNFPFSVVEKVGDAFYQHAQSKDSCRSTGRKRRCRNGTDSACPLGAPRPEECGITEHSIRALGRYPEPVRGQPDSLGTCKGHTWCLCSGSLWGWIQARLPNCNVFWKVIPSCLYGLEELFFTGIKAFCLFPLPSSLNSHICTWVIRKSIKSDAQYPPVLLTSPISQSITVCSVKPFTLLSASLTLL